MEEFTGGEAEAGSPPITAQNPDAFERTMPGAHCPGVVPHRRLHSCQLPPSLGLSSDA